MRSCYYRAVDDGDWRARCTMRDFTASGRQKGERPSRVATPLILPAQRRDAGEAISPRSTTIRPSRDFMPSQLRYGDISRHRLVALPSAKAPALSPPAPHRSAAARCRLIQPTPSEGSAAMTYCAGPHHFGAGIATAPRQRVTGLMLEWHVITRSSVQAGMLESLYFVQADGFSLPPRFKARSEVHRPSSSDDFDEGPHGRPP